MAAEEGSEGIANNVIKETLIRFDPENENAMLAALI